MLSTTEVLLRHSIASGVSGVTASTPSATGGPLSLVLVGPPAVRASRRRAAADDLLPAALEDMAAWLEAMGLCQASLLPLSGAPGSHPKSQVLLAVLQVKENSQMLQGGWCMCAGAKGTQARRCGCKELDMVRAWEPPCRAQFAGRRS